MFARYFSNSFSQLTYTQTKSARQKDKQSLYGNFLRGPKLYPHYSSNREQRTIHAEDTKPIDSPDLTSPSALFEAAASKRKQQLIALSEEESEDSELRFTATVEPVTPSSPVCFRLHWFLIVPQIDDNTGDHSNRPLGKAEGLTLETTLHVGYHNVSSSVIRDLFKSFGNITRIKISEQQRLVLCVRPSSFYFRVWISKFLLTISSPAVFAGFHFLNGHY